MKTRVFVSWSMVLFLLFCSISFADEARVELGLAKAVSNRFNIPNPGGSRVSAASGDSKIYGRLQYLLKFSEFDFVRLTIAPFTQKYSYTNDGPTIFNGSSFPANTNIDVTYRFNSYRIGYLRRFGISDSLKLQAGLIGKVRDAKIELSTPGMQTTYSNVGFVPLLNVGAFWNLGQSFELRFDLDGAAAPQGRAFDGMLEVYRVLSNNGSGVSAGMRILEGGADNKKVNTFALLHYYFVAYTLGF